MAHKELNNITVNNSKSVVEANNNEFIACKYDNQIWIGMVINRDRSDNDYKVKFMHPPFPSTNYHWPRQSDECYIPESHVVCVIDAPVTPTGRQYILHVSDTLNIQNAL